MKLNLFVVIAVCLLMSASQLHAQEHNFGLGFIYGAPAGFSVKYWTSPDNALDIAFGWWNNDNLLDPNSDNLHGTRHTHFHVDFLWHSWNAIHSRERLPLFYGLGASAESAPGYTSTYFARGIIGVAWMPRSVPLDIFLEVVPSLPVSRSGGLYFDGAFGARWYF